MPRILVRKQVRNAIFPRLQSVIVSKNIGMSHATRHRYAHGDFPPQFSWIANDAEAAEAFGHDLLERASQLRQQSGQTLDNNQS